MMVSAALALLFMVQWVDAVQEHGLGTTGLAGSLLQQEYPSRMCRHAYPRATDVPAPVNLKSTTTSRGHRLSKRASGSGEEASKKPFGQLKIKTIYHDSVKELTSVKMRIVTEKVVPEAVGYWQDILKVRSDGEEATIRLNRMCLNNQYFVLNNGTDDEDEKSSSVLQQFYCNQKCVETRCGEVDIPPDHLDACRTCTAEGLDCQVKEPAGKGLRGYDFVLYVTAISTDKCSSIIGSDAKTVAYAAHCQQEARLDRPIAGHTNLCPEAIIDGESEIQWLISTVKHELLHAIGFSMSLFAYYRDPEGKPYTPREADGNPPIDLELGVRKWTDKIIKKVSVPWKVRSGVLQRELNFVVTPKVQAEVRDHFGCPDLIGAELEDQGGDGTMLTHWEKRVFNNEAMTGTVHSNDPLYSRVTFALLEDTGWYIADYSKASNISWGHKKGCDFVQKSCLELMEKDAQLEADGDRTTPRSPFCSIPMSGSSQVLCTDDRTAVGSCNLVTFQSAIEPIYQNFKQIEGVKSRDVPKAGGFMILSDYCPYVQEFTWRTENNSTRGTACRVSGNQPEKQPEGLNFALEKYGEQSKCFEQGSSWSQSSCQEKKQVSKFGAGCYEYSCHKDEGKVVVVVSSGGHRRELVCDGTRQNISVSMVYGNYEHVGSIVCPPCEDLCGPGCTKAEPNLVGEAEVEPTKVGVNETLTCKSKSSAFSFLSSLGIF